MGSSNEPSLKDIMDSISRMSTDLAEKLDAHKTTTDNRLVRLTEDISHTNNNLTAMEQRLSRLEAMSNNNLTASSPNDSKTKQEALRQNICVHGIPYCENEDLNKIIAAVTLALNVNVTVNDITNSYRTKGTEGRPGLIVIRFATFNTKLNIMSASKAKKLTLADLGMNSGTESSPIYINNHLIPHYAQLLMHGKRAVADGKLAACWFARSSICVKPTPSSDLSWVNDISELNNIIASQPNESENSAKANQAPKRKASKPPNTVANSKKPKE